MTGEVRDRIARWIAGDITLADSPGVAIRLWRDRFGINQPALSKVMGVSPSVISDYEAGRRKSPGAGTIKKIVDSLLKVDEQHGGKMFNVFSQVFGTQLPPEVVLEIREYTVPVDAKAIVKAVSGDVAANRELLDRKIFGYTVIDSHKAILALSADDFRRLYGLTTERALVFTGVTTGRSPLVAVKVIGITPGMVVLHGDFKVVDDLGIKIAEILRVPLVLSKIPTVNELLTGLRKCAS
ncbi:MAG: helix-turn-helix domain-containing protein [Methanobacteriota archaeon]